MLDVLGYIVKDKDPNGVDLYFTCPFKKFSKIKRSSQLIELFDRHKPTSDDSLSDMNASLSEAIADYQYNLAHKRERRSISTLMRLQKVRKLSLYIFTDAVWYPRCDVSPVIKSLVDTLIKQNLPKQQIGIQFVRFGDYPEGITRLERLDRMKVDGEADM